MWCNPASIRSCHGRNPGSNSGRRERLPILVKPSASLSPGVQPSGARLCSEDERSESSGVPGRRSRPGARRNTFRRCGRVDKPRGDTHRGRQPVGATIRIVPTVLGSAGLQPTRAGVVFPGAPEVRPRDETRNYDREVAVAQSEPVVRIENQLPNARQSREPMVQRTTIRALCAQDRGSNPRRLSGRVWGTVTPWPATPAPATGSRFDSETRVVRRADRRPRSV